MRSPLRWLGGLRMAALWVALSLPLPTDSFGRLSVEALYAKPAIAQVTVSPTGEFLASIRDREGWDTVVVQVRASGESRVALRRLGGILRLDWIGDNLLLVWTGMSLSIASHHVIHVARGDSGLSTQARSIDARGNFVSFLREHEGEVLWAIRDGAHGSVYRVPIEALYQRSPGFEKYPQVARLRGQVSHWVADASGVVRAARIRKSAELGEVWYREGADRKWRMLRRSSGLQAVLLPVALASDDRDLIVVSNLETDTIALQELSAETGELGRELFAHPDADVIDVLLDPSGAECIGAVYEREGLPEFHYFDSFRDRLQASLERALPGEVVEIASLSRGLDLLVARTRGPRDPGTFYVVDRDSGETAFAGSTMPWIDAEALAPVEALRVSAPDGTQLDVFLARPRSERRDGDRPPLVVLPHGGPVGVRDTRDFDPLVQYLADGGLAVLQVNYRGSAGRGESFLEAGKRQWSQGIEDDVEAAVEAVVERGWVDDSRICIAGASYGGYSALMSVIRKPEMFRCAASVAGPTDVPMQLFHFGFAASEKRRELLADFIGDPREDYDRLRSISPVYRAAEIRVPVLLLHGTLDQIVDVDHFHRMRTVLEGLGKPYETFLLVGGGHAPTGGEWVEIAVRLRAFLLRQLRQAS